MPEPPEPPRPSKYKTYLEYFKKRHGIDLDPNQPMLECIPLRLKTRGLMQPPGKHSFIRAGDSKSAAKTGTVYIPLQLARPHPLSGTLWSSISEMAGLVWRLESFLLAHELYDKLRPQESGTWGSWKGGLRCEQKPKLTGEEADKSAVLLMLEAITAGSCNEDVNYQVRGFGCRC